MQTESLIDAAALTGRQQAFAFVASHCSVARAQCLREIRESRAYEQLGLTWEDFCTQQAGISRVYAEKIIARLDEFGESYFKLAQLARISPENYRRIADHVHDDAINIEGESPPPIPKNAPPTRTAIRHLCYRIRQAEARSHHSVSELQVRLDAVLDEISRSTQHTLPVDELIALRSISKYAVRRWRKLSKTLHASQPV